MNIQTISSSAAKVQVTDWSLWIKHISGDRALSQQLADLHEGQTVTLLIGGHEGVWVKKANGKDGRPTQGLKPLGAMKDIWFDWFRSDRGALIDIVMVQEPAPLQVRRKSADGLIEQGEPRDRGSAWSAFVSTREAGWCFERQKAFDRASLHERGGE